MLFSTEYRVWTLIAIQICRNEIHFNAIVESQLELKSKWMIWAAKKGALSLRNP